MGWGLISTFKPIRPYPNGNHWELLQFGLISTSPPSTITFISYQILFSHVRMTLATLQPLPSLWPCAHSSHFGFIGVGGDILLTSSALRPYAHSSHLGFIGVGGNIPLTSSALRPCAHSSHLGFTGVVGGELSTYIIRFEALCSQQPFRVYWGGGGHSTYIIRFEALCSQQPFRVSWDGGEETFYLHHPL